MTAFRSRLSAAAALVSLLLAATPVTAMQSATPVAAMQPAPALDTLRIAAAFQAEFDATAAPGAAIAVVQDGRIVFSRALGVRNAETGDSMTVASLVRIGSVTKSFTGLTAALLSIDGRLDLQAPLAAILPTLSPALGGASLHQLLTHTGGMADEAAGNGSHDDDALERRVSAWGPAQRFADPGDVYSYSSPGYWLAGYTLQQATGTPYADLVTERVLAPLGMLSSTFRPLDALTRSLAVDHRVVSGKATVLRPFQDDASTWPSGSLFSNVTDLARYAIVLMDDGRIDGAPVLPPAAVRLMTAAHERLEDDATCGYSYGLSVCDREALGTVSHYGFRVGSGAVFTLAPGRRVAVIILANRNGGIFRRTESEVLRQLRPVNPSQNAAPEEPVAPAMPVPATSADQARLVGHWVNGTIALEVAVRQDSLVYRYAGTEQRAIVPSPGVLRVLDATGSVVQQFRLVRGTRTGRDYLHDGLSGFARREH